MKTVVRISIKGAWYPDGDTPGGPRLHEAARFAETRSLRFGNGVVFAVKGREADLVELLGQVGLQTEPDDFTWDVLELSDLCVGAIIRDRYRVTGEPNGQGIPCGEVKPRPGMKRCRKNLLLKFPDPASELRGVYGANGTAKAD